MRTDLSPSPRPKNRFINKNISPSVVWFSNSHYIQLKLFYSALSSYFSNRAQQGEEHKLSHECLLLQRCSYVGKKVKGGGTNGRRWSRPRRGRARGEVAAELLGVELVLQLHEFAWGLDLVGNLLPLREETLAVLEGHTLGSAAGEQVLLLLTAGDNFLFCMQIMWLLK